jgi:hypothetical protein
MKYPILILALLTSQIASARIEETKEACEKRYGEGVIKDGVCEFRICGVRLYPISKSAKICIA